MADSAVKFQDYPVAIKARDNGDGTYSLAIMGGEVVPVQLVLTRPANTTAYIANDALANATSSPALAQFAAGRTATGGGYIAGVTAQHSQASATHRIEIDLYSAAITAIADHAEATRLAANKALWLGTIALPALAKKTANSDQAEAQSLALTIPYKCGAGGLLYCVLRTLDAHTPASAAVTTITFFCDQR